MPRFFVKNEQIDSEIINIIGEDVKHIKNVLRKEKGDIIEICDTDKSILYNCEIKDFQDDHIIMKILETKNEIKENVIVDIYQGLPKADKMELIIQKAVELGVNSIIPLKLTRCVVKLDNKTELKKIERWQKIAKSAAKQSGRLNIPKIENVTNIQNLASKIKDYDIIIVCYENEKLNTLKSELKKLEKQKHTKIGIVIGPEGGIEEKEIQELEQNGAKIVTLGNRILRTETVALNVLSIIMYELEN